MRVRPDPGRGPTWSMQDFSDLCEMSGENCGRKQWRILYFYETFYRASIGPSGVPVVIFSQLPSSIPPPPTSMLSMALA